MKNYKKSKSEKPRRAVRFKGICAQAEELGVDRIHLWKVITGRRESRSLLARYQSLVGGSDE